MKTRPAIQNPVSLRTREKAEAQGHLVGQRCAVGTYEIECIANASSRERVDAIPRKDVTHDSYPLESTGSRLVGRHLGCPRSVALALQSHSHRTRHLPVIRKHESARSIRDIERVE